VNWRDGSIMLLILAAGIAIGRAIQRRREKRRQAKVQAALDRAVAGAVEGAKKIESTFGVDGKPGEVHPFRLRRQRRP
jgi:hypothetical protein